MILLSTTIVITVFGDVEGPELYDISFLPEYPVDGDNISIFAYSIDPSGISHVQVSSTVDGAVWLVKEMDFHACLCFAGGRWTASFGPVTNSSNAAFFITAFDDSPRQNQIASQTFTIDI